jgi:hypothetical protein
MAAGHGESQPPQVSRDRQDHGAEPRQPFQDQRLRFAGTRWIETVAGVGDEWLQYKPTHAARLQTMGSTKDPLDPSAAGVF